MNTEKRFFEVDDGGIGYTIVANSVDHAKQILRNHGVLFIREDGSEGEIDDPSFADLEWKEVPMDAAKQKRVYLNDGHDAVPLAITNLGDFFCTEW